MCNRPIGSFLTPLEPLDRSGIYYHTPEQKAAAEASKAAQNEKLGGKVVTEIEEVRGWYWRACMKVGVQRSCCCRCRCRGWRSNAPCLPEP